jgi:hypothetical protein
MGTETASPFSTGLPSPPGVSNLRRVRASWFRILPWVAAFMAVVAGAAPTPPPSPEPGAVAGPTVPPLEPASTILARMTERARQVAGDTSGPVCVYRSLSLMETLDGSGAVRRSREKVYEVTLRQGVTHNRVLAVDGRTLSEDESRAASEKEKRWRDSYAGERGGSMADRMDQLVNDELVARYEFKTVAREAIRGIDAWVLEFRPKPGDLPADRLIDRVLNLLHGRVWISVAEAEVVRAEVWTQGTLRLWGGFLGSLEFFRLHLDREPTAIGPWFNRHAEITVRGRKLFTTMHVRLREVGGDVRALP